MCLIIDYDVDAKSVLWFFDTWMLPVNRKMVQLLLLQSNQNICLLVTSSQINFTLVSTITSQFSFYGCYSVFEIDISGNWKIWFRSLMWYSLTEIWIIHTFNVIFISAIVYIMSQRVDSWPSRSFLTISHKYVINLII